jgi:sugar phosphate isomerase/epimerase
MSNKLLMISMFFSMILGVSCKSSGNEESNSSNGVKISLAQWSLNKQFFSGELSNLDFARVAGDMGFGGIEYVNQFFKDKANDFIYLDSLNAAAEKAGVDQVLIMIDEEGELANTDQLIRAEAIENHKKWIRAASYLGCHSIRVNLYGQGSAEEVGQAAVEGLKDLAGFAKEQGVSIIVENHGGLSSNAAWLADVISRVKMSNCGTLPDFGNFCIKSEGGKCVDEYDKYQGVIELMPYAKAVSAKSFNFNSEGEETTIDYERMLSIVKDAGYTGFIGVEYEGDNFPAIEGIKLTKVLIEKHW